MNNPAKKTEHVEHIPIFIDEVKYQLTNKHVTGAQLRALVPIPDNQDLWFDTHGNKDDELIAPNKEYTIKPGSHFYTAPSSINPGEK